MNVVAIEFGDRPFLMTKARRFAPEGAKLLAEVLERMKFADDGVVIVDWSNQLGLQPEEVAKPVLLVRTAKLFPDINKTLTVEVRLDIEDTFGHDEMTADILLGIIQQMEDKMLSTIERAKEPN